MKQTAMLTTASLLNILLMMFHLTGDILFKMAPAGLSNLFAVFIFVVLLCGTLLLAGQRSGYIVIFGSVLGLVIPVIHMNGTRGVIGGEIGNSSGAFFFVWILLALGITATFSIILSARALWSLPWRRSRRASTVVVRFSRSRGRYERQGLLAEPEALERAERECAGDAPERAQARLRNAAARRKQDRDLAGRMADRIRQLFPRCPAEEARAMLSTRPCGAAGESAGPRPVRHSTTGP
jgi:hypothetical protein